jgi:hypothetical protein
MILIIFHFLAGIGVIMDLFLLAKKRNISMPLIIKVRGFEPLICKGCLSRMSNQAIKES